MTPREPHLEQADAVLAVLKRVMGPDMTRRVYLYGSAVAGGLRPESDLDLFVVTDRPISDDQRRALIHELLPLSGRKTRGPGWRPLEVTAVALPTIRPWRYPPRWELQYGEWLREEFLAGNVAPWPAENPDLAILVTMVRASGVPLAGPPPADLLDPVPPGDVVRATLDELAPLLADLDDDTRNVLLTLARAWSTLATGEIRSKDAAADWALERLPAEHQPVLARARTLYVDGGWGEWEDVMADVRSHASFVADRIRQLG